MRFTRAIFLKRLAEVQLFSWGFLAYHLFAMLSSRVFLNSDSLVEFAPFWALVFIVEHVFIFSLYGLAKKFKLKFSALGAALTIFLIGGTRTYITSSMAIVVGIDSGVALQYQILIGACFELTLMAVWVSVKGAFQEHQAVVKELNETRSRILSYRENAAESLVREQDKLSEHAQQTLLPQLQRVESEIEAGGTELVSRWGTAAELRGIIYNQVRPLFESLSASAKNLVEPPRSTPNHFMSVVAIPKTFRIQDSIFPGLSGFAALISFFALPIWVLDVSWLIPSAALTFTYFLSLFLIKKMLSKAPAFPAWVGVPALVAISLVSVVPAYSAAVFFYTDTEKAVLYGLALVWVSLFIVAIFALLDSFDYGAKKYVELLEAENLKLNHEVTVFDQQLWVIRKNWSLVLHGTVQASLTAALTRLNSSDADEKTLELAKKDLERAMNALSSAPSANLQLEPALKDLVETWSGVCEIEVEMHPEIRQEISQDPKMVLCVNEILKEAVSNAVRHGDAERAWVLISKAESGDQSIIDLVVRNDGRTLLTGTRKGIGSKLLDELTLDWSLKAEEERGQTILEARLPFSRVEA